MEKKNDMKKIHNSIVWRTLCAFLCQETSRNISIIMCSFKSIHLRALESVEIMYGQCAIRVIMLAGKYSSANWKIIIQNKCKSK